MPAVFAVTAASTVEAIRLVQRDQPRCVVVDLDQDSVDGLAICRVAAGLTSSVILVTTSSPERVPAALKTGCDAVLLKPFTPNLLAARLGRLFRESATNNGDETVVERRGSNRVWPETSCPACRAEGATSFEFSSHRRCGTRVSLAITSGSAPDRNKLVAPREGSGWSFDLGVAV